MKFCDLIVILPAWLRRWGPALLLMITIYYFSSIPNDSVSYGITLETILKKSGHFIGYTALLLTLFRGLGGYFSNSFTSLGLSLVFAIIYACGDEYHQYFVPGRFSTWMDVGIDTLGACFGIAILLRFKTFNQFIRFYCLDIPNKTIRDSRNENRK